MLRAEIMSATLVRDESANPGSNVTTKLILADGSGPFVAYHKPRDGADREQAALYGHDRTSTMVNEAAAWMVAKTLGSPYREMVPDMVVRSVWPNASGAIGGYGSLAIEAPGDANRVEPLRDPAERDPAAFFDALIGQQDRHRTNYRWQPGALGLLDNAYSFAAPDGDYLGWASVFVAARHEAGRSGLDRHEVALLARLREPSPWWTWLEMMLRPDQIGAFKGRIDRMVATERLPAALEF